MEEKTIQRLPVEWAAFLIFTQIPAFLPAHNSHSSLSDEALQLAYRQSRDSYWLGVLLDRYTLLLLGVAMKYLKDPEAAQDAVQQVFLKTLTRFPEEGILNFKGWLYVIMRNYCLQQLRDRIYLAPGEALQQLPADQEEQEEMLLKELSLEQLELALPELAPDQEICIRLFYLQKKSYQQIMEALGFTFAQVKTHIQNGKRNLRLSLIKKIAAKRP